jgi:hypothetical protein
VSVKDELKYLVRSFCNVHRQGANPNIFLFATARGGSTWLMEILASQPGIKYYDEPFNIRRAVVARAGVFTTWDSVMPDTGDPERIVAYLNDIANGRYPFMNPPPFRPHYRFFTNRIVFKVHELEHMMGVVAERCRGQIVYLLRHPIPTTLSRHQFPRLDAFLASSYYARLIGDDARWQEIRRRGSTGSHLQRGTVSWCLENLVPLKHQDFEGLFVSYEELVLNSKRAAQLLLEKLRFSDRDAMVRAFDQPSTNISMSSAETRSMIQASDEQRRRGYLVSKWRSKISPADERDVAAVLDLFGIDDYRANEVLPHRRWLHFLDTSSFLELSTGSPQPATTT